MSNFTPNYNLEQPLNQEFYAVDVANKNMDIIDAAMKANSTAASSHSSKTAVSISGLHGLRVHNGVLQYTTDGGATWEYPIVPAVYV